MGNRFFDAEHLWNFPHLAGSPDGTQNVGVFVPANYDPRTVSGPTLNDNIVTFYYERLGAETNVTLAVFHVGNYKLSNDGKRTRIGTTGGLGGDSSQSNPKSPNRHVHFELWRGRGFKPPGRKRDEARIPFVPVFCP